MYINEGCPEIIEKTQIFPFSVRILVKIGIHTEKPKQFNKVIYSKNIYSIYCLYVRQYITKSVFGVPGAGINFEIKILINYLLRVVDQQ